MRADDRAADDLAHLIRTRRAAIERICARHGASDVRLFGSVARGDAGPDSDVDLLVTLAPDRTILDLAGLQADLSELLGRRVDVGTVDMLKDRMRARVLKDAVPL